MLRSRHGRTVLKTFASLALVLAPGLALAGSIGFRTDAKVTAGAGVSAEVTLTQTGDEAAEQVMVRAQLLDKTIDGETLTLMAPKQSHVWNFSLFDTLEKGIYAIAFRIRYTDGNGYPFEVLSAANAVVAAQPAPRIFGSLTVDRLTVGGTATAHVVAKRPPSRSGAFEVRLITPDGVTAQPAVVSLQFDESGRAQADFAVTNLKMLVGTTMNFFAFVKQTDATVPQTDTIRGTARVVAKSARTYSPHFYEWAAGLFALLLLLELASRRFPRLHHDG